MTDLAPLRLAFMGSPDFSVPTLNALIAAGHDVVCVYAQPPRPAGRGQKERPCPVHAAALDAGIEVRTPKSLKNVEAQHDFAALYLDAAIVVTEVGMFECACIVVAQMARCGADSARH